MDMDSIWPVDHVFPQFQTPQHLDIYDIRSASREIQLTIATLVGLINRPQPRVYLLERAGDAFWLQSALSSVEQVSLTEGDILRTLLLAYHTDVQGLIIYDPALIDSVNIATMLAGQRNGIIVSPDQVSELQGAPYNLPVLVDLRIHKWSNRLQAYCWAKDNLRSEATPRLVAGFDPKIAVGLRPFLVATRAFIYWLDPLNILPQVGLLSERALMQQILRGYAPHTGHFGWFIQEGSGVSLTSQNALPVFATDYCSNLEVWTGVQDVQLEFPGLPKETRVAEPNKIYVSFTMSEGDNLQYIQGHLLDLWRDPQRGELPIGWVIPAILRQAAPAMLDYYLRTATPNDEFIAAPSGVGYMYPSNWPVAQLPAALEAAGRLMQSMHLTTLEVLDSNFGQDLNLMLRALCKGSGMALIDRKVQQRYGEILQKYGVRGIWSGGGQDKASWKSFAGVPMYQNLGMATRIDEAISMIKEGARSYQKRPAFLNMYVLAWNMGPTDLKQVMSELGDEYEVVTPGELLAMLTQE